MDSNDEDKISEWSLHSGTSHHCLFHRNGAGGSTNAVNIIIQREGKHIFCLSLKFCLKLFLIDCSSQFQLAGSVPCLIFVAVLVFVCPQSTAFNLPWTSGWRGWWEPELMVALSLKLQAQPTLGIDVEVVDR